MNEIALVVGLSGAGALLSLWRSWVNLDRARHIEDVPTSLIRSAAQGYVELVGEAQPDQAPLRAPLTGETCLWYDFCVERYTRSGKSRHWRTVRRGRSEHSFFLRDETGECHIHPNGAHTRPRTRQRWYGNTERPAGFGGTAGAGLFFRSGRYRYTERRISVGDPLYALGLFQTLQPLSPGEQREQHLRDLLAEWKSDHDRLLERFDHDGDGEIDQGEWETARRQAAASAHAYTLEHYNDREVHVLARPPGRRRHFIISCHDPRRLVRGYRLKGWGLLILAITLTAIAAFLFLDTFGS